MNILDFVDSRDIREHLRSIDFQPSTIEAAYLVWFSKTATLEQKCEVWQEIVQTMPNCSLEATLAGLGRPAIPDFHAFLRWTVVTTSGASMRLRVGQATFINMKRRLCPTGNFVGPSARHSAVMRNVPRRCAVMMSWRAVQRHAYASPGARSMPTKNIIGKIGSW